MPGENETDSSKTSETSVDETTTTETTSTEENKTLIGDAKTEETTAEFVPLTPEDITFPEGVEVDETLRDEALSVINNRELSPKEQLQGLIDLQMKAAQQASEASSKMWSDTQKEWQDAVKADPEIGGDKLTSNISAINKLVEEYGSPKLTEAFAITGAGNHPEILRFLSKLAGVLSEGKPVMGAPTNQQTTAAERMYPSMKGK